MDKQDILDNIKQNSRSELNKLSDSDLALLLDTTVKTIDAILEKGDSVGINDFGTFSRRKSNLTSVSFFKPTDRLNDRISRKR